MVDVNKPIENPKLLEAINKMYQNNNAETQDTVLKEILNAHFLAPISMNSEPEGQNENGIITLKENTILSFFTIKNTNKQYFFPAFTDWNELRKWNKQEDIKTLIVKIEDYISLMSNNKNIIGCTINPFGENLILTSLMLQTISEGNNPFSYGMMNDLTIQKETKVILKQPEVYPQEMVNAISEFLKTQDTVTTAFLHLMVMDGQTSYLIIIDFTGDKEALFNGIGKTAMPYLNGMFIDIIKYDSHFEEACKNITPFY